MGLNYAWVGKHTLFRFPLGIFLRAIGGIPVDRNVRQGFIRQMIELFASSPTLVLALAPEGTRAKTTYWKTGFYAIATKASVPVALGYIDYQKKQLGIGATLYPSENIEDDFCFLQQFYQNKTGRYPEKKSLVRIRQKDVQRLLGRRSVRHDRPNIPNPLKEDAHEQQGNCEIDGHPQYRPGNGKGS
jgi:1-acyl-sn-glycerol-3-phosphate acyltransferase